MLPMTPEDVEQLLFQTAEAERIERLYELLGGMLQRTATSRFGVPADEATVLVHEVFLSYLQSSPTVEDPAAWLSTVTCDSALKWQRRNGVAGANARTDPKADEFLPLSDEAFWREEVTALPERAREMVRLRYREGLTDDEIATRLGLSTSSVTTAIARAGRKLLALRKQSPER
jgi:RNA polymerase sigma factor (sigma-70 family)